MGKLPLPIFKLFFKIWLFYIINISIRFFFFFSNISTDFTLVSKIKESSNLRREIVNVWAAITSWEKIERRVLRGRYKGQTSIFEFTVVFVTAEIVSTSVSAVWTCTIFKEKSIFSLMIVKSERALNDCRAIFSHQQIVRRKFMRSFNFAPF